MQRSLLARRPPWRRWLSRVLSASVIATVLAYIPYRLVDPAGLRRLQRMESELARTHQERLDLERANAALKIDVEALKQDPGAIERIARRDLGLVYPGELVVRLEAE